VYYANSLSRVFGPPGCGKSFMALDQALTMATGIPWCGDPIQRAPVIYVMAEGQSVNRDRAEAWLSYHHKEVDDLEGWFWVVDEAIQLTEVGVKPFVEMCEEVQPALVFLDTKNAMMVGEENSASDFARMRRALDMIRRASGACVVLIDHTGYEGTRARGTSAATAGMDTEIRVTIDRDVRPAKVTAELTRDKASEPGGTWTWRLQPHHPAAVLVPTEDEPTPVKPGTEWAAEDVWVPLRVRQHEGQGKTAIVDLAKYMIHETCMANDPNRNGKTLTDAKRELVKERNHSKTTVERAWSQLQAMGYLESIFSDPTEPQRRTGAHLWSGPEQ